MESADHAPPPREHVASDWLEGHPELMAADCLHPNDDGYAEMAARMDEELKNLDL